MAIFGHFTFWYSYLRAVMSALYKGLRELTIFICFRELTFICFFCEKVASASEVALTILYLFIFHTWACATHVNNEI